MTLKQAKKELTKLGFVFDSTDCDRWGSQPAELYNVGKDHFTPKFRDVYIGRCNGGFYITSHIHGVLRPYRCRNSYEESIGNIFGGGTTLAEATTVFIQNFTTKTYNRSNV